MSKLSTGRLFVALFSLSFSVPVSLGGNWRHFIDAITRGAKKIAEAIEKKENEKNSRSKGKKEESKSVEGTEKKGESLSDLRRDAREKLLQLVFSIASQDFDSKFKEAVEAEKKVYSHLRARGRKPAFIRAGLAMERAMRRVARRWKNMSNVPLSSSESEKNDSTSDSEADSLALKALNTLRRPKIVSQLTSEVGQLCKNISSAVGYGQNLASKLAENPDSEHLAPFLQKVADWGMKSGAPAVEKILSVSLSCGVMGRAAMERMKLLGKTLISFVLSGRYAEIPSLSTNLVDVIDIGAAAGSYEVSCPEARRQILNSKVPGEFSPQLFLRSLPNAKDIYPPLV